MPVRSKAQRRYLEKSHPTVAATIRAHASEGARPPEPMLEATPRRSCAAAGRDPCRSTFALAPGPASRRRRPGCTPPGRVRPGIDPSPARLGPAQAGPPAARPAPGPRTGRPRPVGRWPRSVRPGQRPGRFRGGSGGAGPRVAGPADPHAVGRPGCRCTGPTDLRPARCRPEGPGIPVPPAAERPDSRPGRSGPAVRADGRPGPARTPAWPEPRTTQSYHCRGPRAGRDRADPPAGRPSGRPSLSRTGPALPAMNVMRTSVRETRGWPCGARRSNFDHLQSIGPRRARFRSFTSPPRRVTEPPPSFLASADTRPWTRSSAERIRLDCHRGRGWQG